MEQGTPSCQRFPHSGKLIYLSRSTFPLSFCLSPPSPQFSSFRRCLPKSPETWSHSFIPSAVDWQFTLTLQRSSFHPQVNTLKRGRDFTAIASVLRLRKAEPCLFSTRQLSDKPRGLAHFKLQKLGKSSSRKNHIRRTECLVLPLHQGKAQCISKQVRLQRPFLQVCCLSD